MRTILRRRVLTGLVVAQFFPVEVGKILSPAAKRRAVDMLTTTLSMSERLACKAVGLTGGGVETASFRPVAVSGAPSEPDGPARTDPVPGGGPSSFLVRAARGGFNRSMGDKTIIKVDSTHSPHGPLGQLYLATGVGVGMRLWRDRPPGPPMPEVARDYETVGYVISGRAELHSEGQMVLLEPGNAWVVSRHARHTYKILEPFTAVEATHPPAEIHDRDRPVGQGNQSDSERDSG